MEEKCTKIWQKVSTALRPQVSADTFKRWFSAVRLIEATDESLTLLVPNNIYQFWIESNHMVALQAAIDTACDGPRAVKFAMPSGNSTVPAEEIAAPIEVVQMEEDNPRDAKGGANVLGLNPRNTFESFVVGPNNEIAHA